MAEYLFQILNGLFCYLLNLGSKKPFSGKKYKWHKLRPINSQLTKYWLTIIWLTNLDKDERAFWIIINDFLTDLNSWIFFPKMTLTQFPTFLPSKNHDHLLMKKVWIFFPEMTLPDVPKIRFFGFRLDFFFQKWRSLMFPVFGFFFQDSQIRVNQYTTTLVYCLRIVRKFIFL